MSAQHRRNRRVSLALSETAWRRLRVFARENGMEEGEALSFLFENFRSVTDHSNLEHRLGLAKAARDRNT